MAGEVISASVPNYNASQRVTKTVTFDGTAGNGAVGDVALFTLSASGLITARLIVTQCSVDLAGAGATLGLYAGATIIGGTVLATTVDAGLFWVPGSAAQTDYVNNVVAAQGAIVGASIKGTVAVADITGGTLTVIAYWDPISSGATLVAA